MVLPVPLGLGSCSVRSPSTVEQTTEVHCRRLLPDSSAKRCRMAAGTVLILPACSYSKNNLWIVLLLLTCLGCLADDQSATVNVTTGVPGNQTATTAAPNPEWSYEEEDLWPKNFDYCGTGHHQSPIALFSNSVTSLTAGPLVFNQGYMTPPATATIINNGHTAQVVISENATVSGGPLPTGQYKFVQLHFHWGGNDSIGSEHTVDGRKYPIELHLVHYHERFATFNDAMGQKGGVLVLAAWFGLNNNVTPFEKKVLQPIVDTFPRIQNMANVTRVWNQRAIYELLPDNKDTYFHYDGSLTTPSCNENVLWIVFNSTQTISHSQLEAFRSLNEETLGAMTLHQLENNFRHVQPLYNRTVFLVQSSSACGPATDPVVLVMHLAVSSILFKNM